MQTKYILHGGNATHINTQNDSFFTEILKDTLNNPKVLLVFFAKKNDEIASKKVEVVAQFEKNKEKKSVSYEVANDQIIINQIKNSDVVYLHGGDTLKLLNILSKFIQLKDLFKGKTIAGESAGAYVLSTYFYSKTIGKLCKGLGHVPVKIICHYEGKNEDKLKVTDQGLETLLLRDYEYKMSLL